MKKKWFLLENGDDLYCTDRRTKTKKAAIKEFIKYYGFSPEYITTFKKYQLEWISWYSTDNDGECEAL